MRIRVLGSAAGGGFPQWNCNCANCAGLRNGSLNARSRTQSSIAISVDGIRWVLINASPDIRTQINQFDGLQPGRAARDTGIAAVLLVDSQVDHTAGLLTLREGCPFDLYCTDMVYEDLTTGFPVLNMLKHWNGGINRHLLPIDGQPFTIAGIEELQWTAVPLASKAPPYSPHREDPHPGDNVGLWIEDTKAQRSLFYAPGLGAVEEHLHPYLRDADCVLVDGTFWTENEMAERGVGTKPASAMGHLYLSGDDGMLAQLRAFPKPHKVLIHINNTNPILDDDSPERAQVAAEGIDVAYDGMDWEL